MSKTINAGSQTARIAPRNATMVWRPGFVVPSVFTRAISSLSWNGGVILLAPILVLGAALRLAGLSQRGLIYWDEGKFSLEGVRLLSVFHTFPSVHASMLAGKAVGTAKPTHALLIAVAYTVFGVHDYAPLLMNAGASVLEIGVLFLLARQIFGTRVALMAAAFLAVSGYDIIYARSALSESDADLIFLTGVLIWWWVRKGRANRPPRWWDAVWPGMALGLAFTVNYRLIVYIAILVAVDLVMMCRDPGWRNGCFSVAGWSIGIALFPMLWEFVGLAAQAHGLVLFRNELTGRPTSYLAEVMYQLHGGRQAVLRFRPLPYIQWYLVRQGLPMSLLFLVGLVLAASSRSGRWLIPIVLVVMPYVVYMFAPFIVPRNLDAALPFTSLLAAGGLAALVDRIRMHHFQPMALMVAALFLAIPCAQRDWSLVSLRSGFALAAGYVEHRHDPGALAVNEVMRFYMRDPGRGCDAPRMPSAVASLEAADRAGDEYAVVDQYGWPISRYLRLHARRVARFPTLSSSLAGEDLVASENGIPPVARSEFVDVYALDSLHLSVHGVLAAPQSCSQDRLN